MSYSLEQQLTEQLGGVAQRGRKLRRRLVLAIGFAAIAIVAWLGLKSAPPLGPTFAIYGSLAAAACIVAALLAGRRGWTKLETARRVEAKFPDLNAALLTALEQAPDVSTGRLTVLQHQVMLEALAHSVSHGWSEVVPRRRLLASSAGAAIAAGVLTFVLWNAWDSAERPRSLAVLAPGLIPLTDADLPVTVDPGDAELERGSSLLVLARFKGPLPNHVHLVTVEEGRPASQLTCDKALGDPVFGARVANITRDFNYRIEFDGKSTRDYKVTVYDLPALERSDLLVQFPTYTDRVEQKLENAFAATVIEGSRVTITCLVNKPLASAVLIDKRSPGNAFPGSLDASERDPGKAFPGLPLTRDANDPMRWSITLTPKQSVALKLHLTDDRDRHNRDPEEFRIDVVPNLPPKIEIAFPGKDVRVSPLEEFSMEGRVADDIALLEFGVNYEVAGRDPVNVPLWKRSGDAPQAPLKWLLPLEELHVDPDDLLSYHVYAVDYGPDGQPRQTMSDMYFAEVRPFEETFRQMDAPPGGQSQQASSQQQQQGNKFNKLIETQKQIVSATFNLSRKTEDWSDQREDSVKVIKESQEGLREKLLAMIPEMQSLPQQRLAGVAAERMETNVERLDEAIEQDSSTPLPSALTAAQAAYQSLLKLRARDHRVMKGQQQQQGGSSGSASPNEQQLQELELTNKKNRYESRQTAAAESQTSQQEDLGILDRLRELARRQADLAEKLKELEFARRGAGTEQQKEEIERQLKRLREEQQQLLQDSDELRNRIAQSNRQDQLANTRQQLEQTRQRQLDATEKLREGQLSQALSSATRAERELQELHNDFRQQTSARFADAMRNLRDEARQLTNRENELREQLKESTQEENRPTLRKSRDRTALENEFREQRKALGDVLEQSKELVKESETAEPLLAQQLYEALRGTRETKLEAALDAVPSLIKQGFVPAAEKAEEQVKEGLDRLQKGIEQAAEAVLGNEVESLKRAKSTLAELSQQLQQEFERQEQNRAKEGQQSGQGQSGENGNQQPGDGARNDEQNRLARDPTGREPNEKQTGDQNQRGQSGQQGAGRPQNQPGQGQERQPGQNQQGQGQQGQQGQGQQGQGQQGNGQKGNGQQGQGQQGQGQQGQGQGQGQSGGEGDQAGDGSTPGSPNANGRPGRTASLRAGPPRPGNQRGGSALGGFNQSGGGNAGPLTGEGYREWAERLRDVETMVSDAQLQAEVARLRDQARSLRADFKRHSKTPNWDLVKGDLYEPLLELQQKIAEEVARRESPDSLVPIDRDPIPARYRELVRSYYERLAKEASKE